MLSGVQTGNGTPHGKYDIRGIAHARTNRKDNIFMQKRLLIDKAHTVLDIFRFAALFVPNLHEPKHIGRPMSGLLLIEFTLFQSLC